MSLAENYRHHLDIVSASLDGALAETGYQSLLVYSGTAPARYNDDQYYPFRCNPQFRWLVPAAYAHSWLLYEPGARPRLLLYQPDDFWHSVPAHPETFWSECFDIQTFAVDKDLTGLLGGGQSRAFLGEQCGAVAALDPGSDNPRELVAMLNWQRSYKTQYEQDCLREANRIAVRGHLAVSRALRDRCSEMGLHLAYMKACGQGENRLPYDSIVALNEHAAVLHWTALSDVEFSHREVLSLLIDAGAECHGYAADITRTYANGVGLYADLVRAMDVLQQSLIEGIQVGNSYVDLHQSMLRCVAEVLHDFGIIRVSAEQALASSTRVRSCDRSSKNLCCSEPFGETSESLPAFACATRRSFWNVAEAPTSSLQMSSRHITASELRRAPRLVTKSLEG